MIRVLIVSQVRLVSELMDTILKNEPDIQVVGYSTHVEEALRQTSTCDVMAVCAALSNNGALKLARTLGKTRTAPRVIIVGAVETEPATLQYLEAGVAGCVYSQGSVDDLLQAVRAAARQEVILSPRMAALVMQRVSELADHCSKASSPFDGASKQRLLTRREREVLGLIAQGYRNQEISRQLTIELGTTKNHVHNILDKLQVATRRDAVACWPSGTHQF